ncbi:class I SAM-dependent methyltransferase [Oceanobacillus damuensis]|uniref:class I SAM-dependent methyltransferase n=1 Tax=Oceanobacillus damuensis TaxID=937928 RepID=UPI00082B99B4|nr:class I SAM-dependent methyltransferase [Oceanobacillus damuensis]
MLKDTGERVIPEKMKITNGLLLEHIARYHFASEYVQGRVLDFASGSGYGSHIIAKLCKNRIQEVIGIDNEKEAVDYAKLTYYHPLSTYLKGDVTDPGLPEKLGTFDTILSFETIEHVRDEERFLSNIYKMLKPGGTLILSTPFGKGRGKPCGSPFHIHQLTVKEFKNLFTGFSYTTTSFFFQKGVLIEPAIPDTNKHYPLGIAVCRK